MSPSPAKVNDKNSVQGSPSEKTKSADVDIIKVKLDKYLADRKAERNTMKKLNKLLEKQAKLNKMKEEGV